MSGPAEALEQESEDRTLARAIVASLEGLELEGKIDLIESWAHEQRLLGRVTVAGAIAVMALQQKPAAAILSSVAFQVFEGLEFEELESILGTAERGIPEEALRELEVLAGTAPGSSVRLNFKAVERFQLVLAVLPKYVPSHERQGIAACWAAASILLAEEGA